MTNQKLNSAEQEVENLQETLGKIKEAFQEENYEKVDELTENIDSRISEFRMTVIAGIQQVNN